MKISLLRRFFFILFVPSLLIAQWTNDPKINTPVCTAPGQQWFPVIASDNNGGAFFAWDDTRNGGRDVYAQYVDAAGTRRWSIAGIDVNVATYEHRVQAIVADGQGGCIVTWIDEGGNRIVAQRIDSTGAKVWDPAGVVFCASSAMFCFQLVTDGSGGAIGVLQGYMIPMPSSGIDIYVQRITASGDVLWGPSGRDICSLENTQQNPQIISDGAGGAIVTWFDTFITHKVYGQKVNASGIALWDSNGVRVGMSTSSQGDPYVASDGSGGAIFEWGESRGDTSLIYAQHIDAGGARQWSSEGLRIASGQAGRSTGGIVSDGGGGAVMAWIDERSWDGLSDLNSDVYAQRVSGSGEILWTANGIAVCTQPDIQSYAQLVSDGAGGAIIGWTDQRNKGFVHTYGQHISSTGVPTWTSDGIPFNAAESDQSSFSLINTMCSDGLGGAIVTWADGRNDVGGDIFAQKLSGNLTFAGYRTFSPLGIAIAHDQRGRLGVSVKPNKGMPNEINVLEEIFRQGIFPDNPSGDALGGIVIGLSYLHTQNGVLRVDPAMAKTHGWMRLGRWDNRLMHGSRSQDVLKTLSTRGVIQNGVARGFEFVHERSALPPAKYNNALMAQQIALKLNILVSACGMAKPGFGELRYVEPGSNCTGRLVREIAGTIDSALTLPDPSWDYSDLLTVSQKLNHAFEGPMDVIPAGYPIRLALRGVHNIADVPILVEDAGVKPRIVTPQSGSLTEAPVEFALYQNYPNPFNPLTTIEFSLPDPSIVTMKVYNTLGQEVTTLIDQEEMSAGTQAVQFDASGISSGVYFYRVNATAIDENGAHLQRYNVVKKMLVVK